MLQWIEGKFFFENKSTDLLFIYVFMCSIKYIFWKSFKNCLIKVEGTQNDTIETGIGQDYLKVDESLNSHVEYQSEQRCSMDILNLQESVQVCNCCIIFF